MPLQPQNAKAAQQITYDTSTGTNNYLPFSSVLTKNPSIIIFDNQSDVSVTLSDDSLHDFKTFEAGEALILDMRANKGFPSEDFTFPINTFFHAKSAAGTGNFYISYLYAR